MSTDPPSEGDIFAVARHIQSDEARLAYLNQVCAGDTEQRDRILKLLNRDQADSFLESPALELGSNRTAKSESANEGQMVDRYKILQQIGEGGFGIVYMAKQQHPVRRTVALKIIKPGMDTKEVIARFEAERQALALMDHPNIARVFDAGVTEQGRPYFIMELVKGVPLTEFCDQNQLSNRDRLELFVTTCRALQHAHQKGIIHRDLKPSNIMVTLNDNQPVPKVIDFGVSKAISQQLTEKTLFTRYGQMVGTPVYMSPEQAQMSGLDVDTRSDVYSLGILLYELLTGTTPLNAKQLRSTAYAEIQRLIVEQEAPKPSTRLSTLNDQQAKVAINRSTDSSKLRQFVSGDLDWIVMKAIDKERGRRYESASRLAEDIERFLGDETIQARPPSALYNLQKFARRNRGKVIAASLLLATLVLGLIGTSIGLVAADRQTRVAQGKEREKEEQRLRALAAEKTAAKTAEQRRRELYAANMQLADQLWNSPNGDLKKIEELLTAWIPVDESEDFREFSWRYQWTRLYKGAAVTKLKTSGAALSAEGHLLTANDAGIHEWDESGTHFETRWSGDATNVTFSPDGRWAAIALDGQTQLIEVASGNSVTSIPHANCSFSARGEFLAAWTSEAQEAQVWKLSGDKPVAIAPLVLPVRQ